MAARPSSACHHARLTDRWTLGAVTGRTRPWHPLSPFPSAASEESETGISPLAPWQFYPRRAHFKMRKFWDAAPPRKGPAPEARSDGNSSMWLGTGFNNRRDPRFTGVIRIGCGSAT